MMQRINLSVKILVSQVNTAVLLHEELDISTVGKILPSLKREQRKREKQKGKKGEVIFYTLQQQAAIRYTLTGGGLRHHYCQCKWCVWSGRRTCQ